MWFIRFCGFVSSDLLLFRETAGVCDELEDGEVDFRGIVVVLLRFLSDISLPLAVVSAALDEDDLFTLCDAEGAGNGSGCA